MRKIFVSGCYDLIHAGHLQFFREARACGDYLIVCFASDEVLWEHKHRKSALPEDHKRALLESLDMVDEVVMGTGKRIGFDFEEHFERLRPDALVVTSDDKHGDEKREFCAAHNAEYIQLEKTPPDFQPISTSMIRATVAAPAQVPLRVDFAGGWLDVPRHALPGEYIVNCAVSPLVSLKTWDYQKKSGLGGSGAWALLNGREGVQAEIDLGVGWQDPAVISETGCCVWRSGPRPVLDFKRNGDFLAGKLALLWTGLDHDTPSVADNERDYGLIAESGRIAREGVLQKDVSTLAKGVETYYQMQLQEGMQPLPVEPNSLACKYCGGGWGGYAVYLFPSSSDRDRWVEHDRSNRKPVEPFLSFS